ncbi:OsmC-like protein [Roseovarius sp. THAF27]|uniref:OsmC family protein n=1 Tax=Roseovarius sp. THAF27 TaxID=2587850 RepID=UPI00126926F6|nr:OsmC family protein [Roseovarius sp. THAF27]QFT80289.1 OsmC-like protein [Roseovarius sp. THAF27]
MDTHDYTAKVVWTGNRGDGTRTYKGYDRTWNIETAGKPVVACSNDPVLGGDPKLHNPEDLLLATVSACHMLWYLHFASDAGIAVQGYVDDPLGEAEVEPSGKGRFTRAVLRPVITVPEGTDLEVADAIHGRIHDVCFIARSVAFPIVYEARYEVAAG